MEQMAFQIGWVGTDCLGRATSSTCSAEPPAVGGLCLLPWQSVVHSTQTKKSTTSALQLTPSVDGSWYADHIYWSKHSTRPV